MSAGRFLHVNLNAASAAETGAFYEGILGLRARMQTDASVPCGGEMLGLAGQILTDSRFYYGQGGGRNGCALEVIEWRDPGLVPANQPEGEARLGIHAVAIAVTDLAVVKGRLRAHASDFGQEVQGLITGQPAVLVRDPNGSIVEITQAPPGQGPTFGGILLTASDIDAAVDFLVALGFGVLEPTQPVHVAAERLSLRTTTSPLSCRVARLALPEDADRFTVRVVEVADVGLSGAPASANTQGLYRCALRVEDVNAALATLPAAVEVTAGPIYCPLPGTKIGGLTIAFLRSPDGVVFEYVERPASHFSR
ncbi:hypothetical protein MAHJHV65_46160 [Mycobacterium avium subsp. hominissuis]